MIKLSYIKSDDRSYNIERCLSLIKSEVTTKLRNAKRVVIKPNCISDKVQLASTHVSALEAVLAFIRPHVKGQITLAERVKSGNTLDVFKNLGYLEIQDRYDLAIADLNDDEFDSLELIDNRGKPWQARIPRTLLSSDYLISLAPPKTHDTVIYSGVIENISGSLLEDNTQRNSILSAISNLLSSSKKDKTAIQRSYQAMNENTIKIAMELPVSLSILDGFETMEGNGPIEGEMVPSHFAIAGTDAQSVDWLACQLLGISDANVGYLTELLDSQDKSNYFIVGDSWRGDIRPHRLHSNFQKS